MSKAEDYTHVGATNDIKELGNTPADKGYQPSGISKAEERTTAQMCEACWMHNDTECGYECRSLQRKCTYNDLIGRGYELAEKDLGLTWEDVKRIVEIADKLCPYTSKDFAEFQENFQTEEAYYKKVLELFQDGQQR